MLNKSWYKDFSFIISSKARNEWKKKNAEKIGKKNVKNSLEDKKKKKRRKKKVNGKEE